MEIDPKYVPWSFFSYKRYVVYFFKVFENGMKYQLSQIIEEHLSFLEDDGVDYSEFLKSPNYPAKTFSLPSKASLLGSFSNCALSESLSDWSLDRKYLIR